jgi:hypothetical protein
LRIPAKPRYDQLHLPAGLGGSTDFREPFLNETCTAMTNRLDFHLPAAGAFALVGLLLAVVRTTVVVVVGVVTPPAQV